MGIERQRQNVRSAFESILRADYIGINEIDELALLEKYYVDTFNNVSSLLQKQDNYVAGRRGTGKTTLLLRGYYECLKTITSKAKSSKSIYFNKEKALPIYIDLSTCKEVFSINHDISKVEINFVNQIVGNLKKQLSTMFGQSLVQSLLHGAASMGSIDEIEKILINGMELHASTSRNVKTRELSADKVGIAGKLSSSGAGLSTDKSAVQEYEVENSYTLIRGLDIQTFLNKIDEIRKAAGIDYIFIFLDEYSDLSEEEQRVLATLLKRMLGSKINMYFKIGVITDRFYFGDNIRIGRDLFAIPLDLNEFVERFGGLVPTLKHMQQYITTLLEKRIELFCEGLHYTEIFKNQEDINTIFMRIAREAMGVPRTIGLILQNAWIQADSQLDGKIGLQEINYGMSATRKTYFKQFQGAVKARVLPRFYMDMWSDILEKAVKEKNKSPGRPASHIMIDPLRKDYMNVFCENFIVHFLEESRSSKYGGNYNLYCIDYDICLENNIRFAEDKDEFTAIRFIYDNVLSPYDGYFVKDKLKSYRCPECGRIYEEIEVSQLKVKRCFDDDTKLTEIIHRDAPRTSGNYTEVEIKILGLISELDKNEALSAQDIADAVGCSRQKVALWCSRVLTKRRLVNIIEQEGRNTYYGGKFLN